MKYSRTGFGGGCHWCTEAVFLSLKGVQQVDQGWIASQPPYEAFSEAVIVTYDSAIITLADLVAVHLHTHAATSNHSMRYKYRSAVYWFDAEHALAIKDIIARLQSCFTGTIITQALPFVGFKSSLHRHLNYYYNNPEKPFCNLHIHPKLQLLKKEFAQLARPGEENKL